jgi:anti-sigma B factor antagonist
VESRIWVETHAEPGGRTVVQVAGELDMATGPQLARALESVIGSSGTTEVIIDMAALCFLDACGLRAIVAAHRRAQHLRGTLTARNARDEVDTVLRVTGVADLLGMPVLRGSEDTEPRR